MVKSFSTKMMFLDMSKAKEEARAKQELRKAAYDRMLESMNGFLKEKENSMIYDQKTVDELKNYQPPQAHIQVVHVVRSARRLERGVNKVFEAISKFKGAYQGQEVFSSVSNTVYLWEESNNTWIELAHAMAEGKTNFKPKYIPPKDTEEHIKEKLDIFEKTLNNEDD